MIKYEINPKVAERALDKTDELIESGTIDDAYVRGVKDALGWVLGHYDPPDCFDDDIEANSDA